MGQASRSSTEMSRILFVDDDTSLQEFARTYLAMKGYAVLTASDVKEGLKIALESFPHCLVIDWILRDSSGIDLVEAVRREPSLKLAPVLMISARNLSPEHVAEAVDAGADDFLAKPFNPMVLVAKIQALLRRASWQDNSKVAPQVIRHHDLTLNLTSRLAAIHGEPLGLTYTEFELLAYFLQHRGEAVDRPSLLGAISAHPDQVFHQVVDKHIENLRKKLGALAKNLETVRNVGYRLV